MGDAEPELEGEDSWIGVVPVGEEQAEIPRGSKEESFTAAVVNKMKRALVLGASALLILALNQNTIRELDVSQVLSKPVIVIQTSDNVTRLLGALLRGLRVTAKITYQAVLLENLGVTLTLWSTCGLSRGGLYGEWQGVICTGENSSRVQKYLQQLWNTILFIALILCTGVIVQAQRQSRQGQPDQDTELDLKQHILQRLSALKTRRYHPGKHHWSQARDIDSCAVCLDQFHKNQCLRVLPCSHEFHRDCVDPWLLLQQTCPLCKHNILGNCCGES
uniref:RING finger protein 215 n=2 Tax=Chelydra serpentina TaxID=8475 RepID=A0A8C3XNN2_CHESE